MIKQRLLQTLIESYGGIEPLVEEIEQLMEAGWGGYYDNRTISQQNDERDDFEDGGMTSMRNQSRNRNQTPATTTPPSVSAPDAPAPQNASAPAKPATKPATAQSTPQRTAQVLNKSPAGRTGINGGGRIGARPQGTRPLNRTQYKQAQAHRAYQKNYSNNFAKKNKQFDTLNTQFNNDPKYTWGRDHGKVKKNTGGMVGTDFSNATNAFSGL